MKNIETTEIRNFNIIGYTKSGIIISQLTSTTVGDNQTSNCYSFTRTFQFEFSYNNKINHWWFRTYCAEETVIYVVINTFYHFTMCSFVFLHSLGTRYVRHGQ